jgi:serine phosphatase RsbU (regulator of sigma subunit)
MSLRLRLILAFFFLSVVPLGALTVYTYAANARAMREAAGRETELLAGELTQRMQVVTARLTERVELLVDLAASNEAASRAAERAMQQTVGEAAAGPLPVSTTAADDDDVAEALGDLAMLLNNVELRDGFRGRGGTRGRGGGRGGGPPATGQDADAGRSNDGRGGDPAQPIAGARIGPPPAPGAPVPPPPPALVPGLAPPGAPAAPSESERILIDMRPIRLEILKQYASEEEFRRLPEAEQQRIIGEVNQRMLGIAMGIKMGTAEAQRRVTDAQQAAAIKAREAAAVATSRPAAPVAPVAPSAPPTPGRRRATLSGSRIDVTVERDGKVVSELNAEVDLPSLLGTVFSTTRRDRGEVPFAVAKDGRIYTPTPDDQRVVETLGEVMLPDTPPGTAVQEDWVIVTSAGPTGSGLKFGIARPVGDSLNALRRTSATNAAIGLGFIGLALVGIVPLSGRLTRDLSVLGDGVHRIANGDYRARVEVRSADEVGRLAAAFNQMAEDVERHQRAAVGQERIRRELELGRQIQHEMLPHAPLRLGLTEVKGVSVPAREVGGDFFNYFEVASGQIALLVGDVSGKGVGAALLMANIQASLRTRLALGQDLAAIADALDVDIDANTPGAVYATLFIAILDVAAHRVRYVNAGHHAQYILRRGGGLDEMPSTGLPIGMLSGRGYVERSADVAEGDLLFFYTDGCVEAENDDGDMLGPERLEAILRSAAATNADAALALVEDAVKRFRGAREPFDDATMMVVKVG